MDQGGGGGGDGVAGEPELRCAVGAEGDRAVHDGGGDGAEGNPELCSTVGAEGKPVATEGVTAVRAAVAIASSVSGAEGARLN